MAGHSKWANIKHKKAKTDAKRGKVFTKLVKEITVAARMGGSDPSANPRLRTAIEKGKAENLPADNIERAIKKGAGELDGVVYEEGMYEGYGPGGVAVLVAYMTDNKNRTVGEVRSLFTKSGGNLGESGSVSWMFEKKGLFIFGQDDVTEEALMDAALDAGAEDVVENGDDGVFEVYTEPTEYHKVMDALKEAGLQYRSSELTMNPTNTVDLDHKGGASIMRLLDALEDLDDVQDVYANFDISPEEMAKMEG